MKEIGLTLGVVESRVSQIHSSAVLRLRSSLGESRNPAIVEKTSRETSCRIAMSKGTD
jgi:RNA polymerase sigma factor FliA